MSRATWSVVVAVIAVVIAVMFAVSRGPWFLNGDTATQSAGGREVSESAVRIESTVSEEPAASREPQAGSGAALQEEAESYVKQLTEPVDEPIQLGSAEAFVAPDQPVSLQSVGAGEQDEPRPTADGNRDMPASAPVSGAPEAAAEAGATESDGGGTGVAGLPAPSVELPLTEDAPLTIAELIGPEGTIPSDAVLYVHTVTPEDNQGIWGIVHRGILQNFAEGVAVHRGGLSEIYQVDIPPHADERRADNTSSFLGRLIHEKTRRSYVYNYRTDRIGRNPDLIRPGEEIVIVSFTPAELISVYKHFVTGQDQENLN